MYFEQFYLGCLAHASYMIGSEGEAAVVDPQRDVDIYLKAADEHQLKIKYIFETHLHADFVSGHQELAARTGAQICIGAAAGATFPHLALRDTSEVRLGKVTIKAFETPGHTPEGTCLVVTDEEKSSRPWAVLTGDTLFIGDVGRPDLSKTHTPQELAGLMYDSLHNKLMALPDDVIVYPAHGAGSLCGRSMRAERSSTIGTERLTNHALQIKSRDAFIIELTTNLPSRPDYFLQDAEINRAGAGALGELPTLRAFSPAEVKSELDRGAIALDVRSTEQFAAAHVPSAVNIPLSGQFATWAGIVLGLSSQPILIAETPEQIEEARMRLARVGIEDVRGYLAGGIDGWRSAGMAVAQVHQMTVDDLHTRLSTNRARILDVRRQGEWEAGHIGAAEWHALDNFRTNLPKMSKAENVAVHCKSGYRSMIACSLLQRAGYDVTNVIGGFDAWQGAGLPVESGIPVKA
jgi:hydroxyacylglutathione hydrolase